MNFKKTFKAMKAGTKVNGEKGDLLDIRETQAVEYTMSNILSDDWMIVE